MDLTRTPLLVLLLLPLLLLPARVAALDTSFLELDLEDLMELRLTRMALTNVHHTHPKGEWMVGYQYMPMGMKGSLDGSSGISTADIHSQYMVAPISMDMEMHMLDVMCGLTDRMTVMAMLPYLRKSMEHVTRDMSGMGGMPSQRFTTSASGLGDLKLSALYSVYRDARHRIVGEIMMSVPTGSTNAKDATAMSGGVHVTLPYPMQLGSGSLGLRPGITYLGQSEKWLWGGHANALVFLHDNEHGYRQGEHYQVSAWVARELVDWMSASFRPEFLAWGDVHGSDPRLNPMMVPTADPSLRAGRRLDLMGGINFFGTRGVLEDHKLAIEAGAPVYQSLDGPQLETDYRVTATWNMVF